MGSYYALDATTFNQYLLLDQVIGLAQWQSLLQTATQNNIIDKEESQDLSERIGVVNGKVDLADYGRIRKLILDTCIFTCSKADWRTGGDKSLTDIFNSLSTKKTFKDSMSVSFREFWTALAASGGYDPESDPRLAPVWWMQDAIDGWLGLTSPEDCLSITTRASEPAVMAELDELINSNVRHAHIRENLNKIMEFLRQTGSAGRWALGYEWST